MNKTKYTWILYVIVFVILGTITIQIYWNYKNYLVNKQQLVNDVQHCLDNAVETYYTDLAANETFAFAFETQHLDSLNYSSLDSLGHKIELIGTSHNIFDSLDISLDANSKLVKVIQGDTVYKEIFSTRDSLLNPRYRTPLKVLEFDSLTDTHFRTLTSRVLISLSRDSLNLSSLKKIDTLFSEQLKYKTIEIDYGLRFNTLNSEPIDLNSDVVEETMLKISSKSPYLHYGIDLSVFFTNPVKTILKRSFTGILISTLLILVVISCLFYLLKIIKHQKQLAEVKNDLISNITHEFKTPIATIGVALESIKNFDVILDKEKTSSYLDMSSDQLGKLNTMVEKLLETATLDSNKLELKLEEINLPDFLNHLVEKHRITLNDKSLSFDSEDNSLTAEVDIFHFENVINNLIDNAIKYGGSEISISLKKDKGRRVILISDNGTSLTKASKERIFEKFYRVPKGNTHDIKGFGIGLYYVKTIIEKHGGTVQLHLNENRTTFKISIPS